ncbi:hypothetical protein [Roseospirillum parvum]|uniref:Uncharacterized protein n=1 Tax=Roseospirillum parvum TaxID=83401 RepID=A0A1G8FIV5_9PROT|nr:hypothetical protein [Roseospirillum parvum]SDH82042.1 hypothetical protein SAMN05421742_11432 [Roseospirillum parvum]
MTASSPTPGLRPRLPHLFAVLLAAGLLAGCSLVEPPPPPVCPDVRIDKTTARVVQFKGSGRDVTDIAHDIRLIGFSGECQHTDEGVELTFHAEFLARRGPAGGREGSFRYFVAIPRFAPRPSGKEVLDVDFVYPDVTAPRVRLRDEEVRILIPVPETQSPSQYPIYLGLQLSPDQLQYNRDNPL